MMIIFSGVARAHVSRHQIRLTNVFTIQIIVHLSITHSHTKETAVPGENH